MIRSFTLTDFEEAYAAFMRARLGTAKTFWVAEGQIGPNVPPRLHGAKIDMSSGMARDRIQVSSLSGNHSIEYTVKEKEDGPTAPAPMTPFSRAECEDAISRFRRIFPDNSPRWLSMRQAELKRYKTWAREYPGSAYAHQLGLRSSVFKGTQDLLFNQIRIHGEGISGFTWTRGGDVDDFKPFGLEDFQFAASYFKAQYGVEHEEFFVSKKHYPNWGGLEIDGCRIGLSRTLPDNSIKVVHGDDVVYWGRADLSVRKPKQEDTLKVFSQADFDAAREGFVERWGEDAMPRTYYIASEQYTAWRRKNAGNPVVCADKLLSPDSIRVTGSGYAFNWQRPKDDVEDKEEEKPKVPTQKTISAIFKAFDGEEFIIPPPEGDGWIGDAPIMSNPPLFLMGIDVKPDGNMDFLVGGVDNVSTKPTDPSLEVDSKTIHLRHKPGICEAMEWHRRGVAEHFKCFTYREWERPVPAEVIPIFERYHDRQPLPPTPPPSGVWLNGHTKPIVAPKEKK